MSLPKPNATFKIPSIYDDIELDGRIYYPRKTERNLQTFGRCFAIVAHPYAPLGGCYDDPVVSLVGTVLLQHGFILITFNFRGAFGSVGRTSWTGKPELSDYVSVYGFLLYYIHAILHASVEEDAQHRGRPMLALGGYSYGSMIASHLPPRDTVVELFKSAAADSAASEIMRRAEDLSRDALAYFDMQSASAMLATPSSPSGRVTDQIRKPEPGVIMGGYDSDATSRRISRENPRRSVNAEKIRQSLHKVRRKINERPGAASSAPLTDGPASPAESAPVLLPEVVYLIVSPILSTVAGFTTMFSKLIFVVKGQNIAPSKEKEFHELTIHPCCCIYGIKDGFTSARKLRRWTEDLKLTSDSRFMAIEVDGGHFWQEPDGIMGLKQGLAEFLKGLVRPSPDFGYVESYGTEQRTTTL